MARPVILGNGKLTVGLNEHGLVHDFYYPYVGQENLTTARSVHHKIGISIDGAFSWTDTPQWSATVDFDKDALISCVTLENKQEGVTIICRDFVDSAFDAFYRRISVTTTSDKPKAIKLFMHQVFQISQYGRADTALFVPEDNYILDYKGRCCLLIYAQDSNRTVFDQFAIGNYGIEGKEGTFKDAEDGELSCSAVEHGSVDSVIRLSGIVQENVSADFDYWIVASDSQFNAEKIHEQILQESVDKRIADTQHYWKTWLSTGMRTLVELDPKYQTIAAKSLMLIKAHIDKRGGIIASCDSSIYNYGRDYYSYVWPRDGAYALWPLIRLGYKDEAAKFFEFCRDILSPDGYLMHKYQPDKAIGSTWHPLVHNRRKELAIQEDETAIVVYMLGEYYEHTKDEDFCRSMYVDLIYPAANFMTKFIDDNTKLPHASYDLWEEKFGTHTYTAAVVYQSLLVAADFAEKFNHGDDAVRWESAANNMLDNAKAFIDESTNTYRKSFLLNEKNGLDFDNVLDVSSFYGITMFGYHDSDLSAIHTSVKLIEEKLSFQTPSGGTPRYTDDSYFKSSPPFMGNPWIVTTLWMAQYYFRAKNYAKTIELIDWSVSHALPSGVLSEQIEPTTGAPISVTPLVWSHAELLNTLLDISKKPAE